MLANRRCRDVPMLAALNGAIRLILGLEQLRWLF
jgi:hypothetical protein